MGRITINKTITYKVSGIFIIALLYAMWGCNTIAYKNYGLLFAGAGASLLAFFIYCLAHAFIFAEFKEHIDDVLSLDIFLFFSGMILSFGTVGTIINPPVHDKLCSVYISGLGISLDLAAAFMSIETLVWSVGILVLLCNRKKALKNKGHIEGDFSIFIKRIRNVLHDNVQLIVLLIIVAIMCYDPNWRQFKWDGYLYYLWSDSLRITSLSNMAMYAHLSQFHSLIVLLFEYVFRDLALAMYLANVILLLVAVVYFYKTIRLISPNRSKMLYLIATSIFAFSPFYLGMVTYYSLDYTMMCILPAVVYYLAKEKWIPFTVSAFFFCFTKEPAIIIYGLLCMGTVIIDLISKKKRIRDLFKTIHYYYMMLPGILWLATLAILGIWSGGESAVGFETGYTIDKLKTLYVLNFSWIFVIIIGLGIVIGLTLVKYVQVDWKLAFLLIFVLAGFTLFSIVFRTANHPRYSDAVPYCLYILAAVIILGITDSRLMSYSILSALSVVMLVSSFLTIDPVSLRAFDTVYVGKTMMIKTASLFGDGSIYNRQALWMEKPYSEAIKDSLNDDTRIVVLTYENAIYDIDGMTEQLVVSNDHCTTTYFWDEGREIRLPIKDEESKSFEITFVGDINTVTDLFKEGETVSIIYPNYLNVEDYMSLNENVQNDSIQEYQYRGCSFFRMKVDV